MIYLAGITISFGMTLWLSKFFLHYVDPSMFMDRPTERKLHDVPVPRFGGIIFGLVFLLLGSYLVGGTGQYSWYFLGGVAIFLLGAVDDYWTLSWKVKLPVQVAIGFFLAAQFVGSITEITFFGHVLAMSNTVLVMIYLLWFIGIMNAVNLIDGMDGLAGGFMLLTCFASIIIGLINDAHVFVLLNAIFLGAMIGFLHFNQRPAKFFMGDTGSLLLGFHLAVLPLVFHLSVSASSPNLVITPFIILASYLIVDTTRVFFFRLRQGKNPLEPDMNHLHHIMFRSSKSYYGTLATIFIILGFTGILAIMQQYLKFSDRSMLIYLAGLSIFIFPASITSRFVNTVSLIIHFINKDRVSRPKKIFPFRIRFIPFLSILYFLALVVNVGDFSGLSANSPLIFLGFGILLLYVLFSPRIEMVAEVLIIAVGIFQGLLILQLSGAPAGDIHLIAKIARYVFLGLISIITIFNYIINSRNLTGEFWTVVDLLLVFILIGLSSLNPIGFGISPITGFEIGVIYFSNKLYAPRVFLLGAPYAETAT